MPTYTPSAGSLSGTESLSILVSGSGGTLTLAQLSAWSRGAALGPGDPNPPVGQPSVAALFGLEQVRVAQGLGWMIATIGQVAAYIAGAALPAFALPASGAGFGQFAAITSLDGSETVLVRQGGGSRALTLAALRAWAAIPAPAPAPAPSA